MAPKNCPFFTRIASDFPAWRELMRKSSPFTEKVSKRKPGNQSNHYLVFRENCVEVMEKHVPILHLTPSIFNCVNWGRGNSTISDTIFNLFVHLELLANLVHRRSDTLQQRQRLVSCEKRNCNFGFASHLAILLQAEDAFASSVVSVEASFGIVDTAKVDPLR